jgi:hypothetical protein
MRKCCDFRQLINLTFSVGFDLTGRPLVEVFTYGKTRSKHENGHHPKNSGVCPAADSGNILHQQTNAS